MLHDFILTHRSDILGVCLDELRSKYPDRRDGDLLDDIPAFVDEVIAALSSAASGEDTNPGVIGPTTAASHGTLRKKQGFDLSRLVHDFGLVCDAITTTAIRYDERPSPREFQILNRYIDTGIALAVESFSEESRADERLERAKDLGELAHEIRNAVSNALAGFELIRQGRTAANGMTADVVQRALSRIGTLVADTIAAARAVNGVPARRAWVSLGPLITELADGGVTERGIRIRVEVEEGLLIDADEHLLVSALSNLLQNAIKFTQENESITLRASSVQDAISIEVEDRCGGLTGGSIEDLFHPFVQKNSDRRGVGLGLGIARRAIEAHGGTLHVRNLPGIGCVFGILIPRTTRVLDK